MFVIGEKFCLRFKSFESFSNDFVFCLVLILLVSQFFDDFCVMAGIVQLIRWSGRVRLSFSFNSLNCISGLVLLCFFTSSNKKCFALLHFAAFSTFNVISF